MVAVLAFGPIRSRRLAREGFPARRPGYASVRERQTDAVRNEEQAVIRACSSWGQSPRGVYTRAA